MSLLETKLSIKSKICLLMTVIVVAFSMLHTGTNILSTIDITTADETCPIQQWKYPNCKPYLNKVSPPATDEQWLDLRQKFHTAVGDQASGLDPTWSNYTRTANGSSILNQGFRVPVEVRTSPGKGRGVFLKSYVQKGQQLWDNRYTARFPNECSVRKFFASIGEEAACSAIMWGYVNDFAGEGLQYHLDLDGSVYFNEARPVSEANAMHRYVTPVEEEAGSLDGVQRILEPEQLVALRKQPGRFGLFATRDLEPGTELLIEYDQFHVYYSLIWYEKLCYHSRGFWGYLTML